MSLKDANSRYSGAAQFFHWLSALLVAGAWLLGQLRDEFARGEPRRTVDFLHISAGQLIVALLALRLIWRFIAPPLPMKTSVAGVWGDRAAKLAHILLYTLLLAVPIAGVVTLFADGKPLPLFRLGEIPSPWVGDKAFEHKTKEIHEWLANGLIFLAALHASAALAHHFYFRDGALKRMTPKWIVR
jgi:cytochrome b561